MLMIIEFLYTVKVSFQEHALVPEPFLVVGLIAVTENPHRDRAARGDGREDDGRKRLPAFDVRARTLNRHGRGAGRTSPDAAPEDARRGVDPETGGADPDS
ncbi:MAG: hypothetical protein ABI914_00835 [Acidobacteriota bacterium]